MFALLACLAVLAAACSTDTGAATDGNGGLPAVTTTATEAGLEGTDPSPGIDASSNGNGPDEAAGATGPTWAPGDGLQWSMVGSTKPAEAQQRISVTDFGAIPDDDTSDSAAFEAAIASLRVGVDRPGVVEVPAGRYLLTETLDLPSGLVLQGRGSRSSLVIDMAGADAPGLVAQGRPGSAWTRLATDVAAGAIVIDVENPAAFAPGALIELEQTNDGEAMYTRSEWDVDWGEGSIGEMNRVVGIDGSTVILASPLNSPFRADRDAAARVIDAVQGVAIQDLSIRRQDDGTGNTIAFSFAADVRVRGVESARTTRAHLALEQVYRCRIEDSIIHGASDFGDGGRAYGVSLARHATGCLVQNNTLYDLRHAIILQLGASGNIVAYNDARGSAGYEDRQPRADLSLHGHWPQANLFEGNVFDRVVFADWWGPSGPGNTLFRNCVLDFVLVADRSDHQRVVGNLIGAGGLTIESDIVGTQSVGNLGPAGPIAAGAAERDGDDGGAATAGPIAIPDSLWLDQPPDFLIETWPPIQADRGRPGCRLPASEPSPFSNEP